MRATIAAILVAAATLSACNRREEAQAPDAPPADPSAAPAAPSPPPSAKRKPGLWEQSISTGGESAVQTSRICFDEATDAKLSLWGGEITRDACQRNDIARIAGGWRFSSVCDMGSGGVVTTTGEALGDFDRHYEVKAHSSTQGAALEQMNRSSAVTIVADWRGPCPEGMQGGDMLLPGGIKINILQAGAR